CVGILVIALCHKRCQSNLHGMKRGLVANVVQAAFSERSPKAFHLSTSLRVIRAGVQELNVQAATRCTESMSSIGRPVIEVEGLGGAAMPNGLDEHIEHGDFALVTVHLQ